MSKPQVVWLIVRLAGVYFAYLALVSLFGLAGSIPALFTLPKIDANPRNANVTTAPNPTLRVQPIGADGNYNAAASGAPEAGGEESAAEKFKGENFKNFAWFLLLTAVYGAAGWYLLRDGRLLYELLDREGTDGAVRTKEAEVTTLNLSDKQS